MYSERFDLEHDTDKNYVIHDSRWFTRDYSYKIMTWPDGLEKEEVRDALRTSFGYWANVSTLTFTEVNSGEFAHITIGFYPGKHGCGINFDGEGNELGHGIYPIYSGKLHFDKDENWTVDPKATHAKYLPFVAAHYMGHMFGLDDSMSFEGVMTPFVSNGPSSLGKADILGIQAIYGVPEHLKKSGNFLKVKSTHRLCNTFTVNVDVMMIGGKNDDETYVFKGNIVWLFVNGRLSDDYPKLISNWLNNAPYPMDAGFISLHHTYVFKGDLYWRFSNGALDYGYPKEIRDGFPGIPGNLDAAVQSTVDGTIYFFKDASHWRYNIQAEEPATYYNSWNPENKYELNKVDTAISTGGKIYLVRNGAYYEFDPASSNITKQNNWIGEEFFDCRKNRTLLVE